MRNRTRALAMIVSLALLATVPARVPAARAGTPGFFEIFFLNLDEHLEFARFRFDVPQWEFGDRAGYRCAWAFLTENGVRVARVQFDRGQTYTEVNDVYGRETNNDFSQCLTEGQDRETKPKPDGLGDTIVTFNDGGAAATTMRFPATSPENSDSWWEVEDLSSDSVEMEMYWRQDVAVVATLTSLSPSLTFSAVSTAAPTVDSISPSRGGAGTQVTIEGANFVSVSSVSFNGTSAPFDVESGGEVDATVPAGATTGPIVLTTPAGTGTSETFTVAGGIAHQSTISLRLSGHLVASGSVGAADEAAACVEGRTVAIQHRVGGGWRTVGRDLTGNRGNYRERIPDAAGVYRAVVGRETLAGGDVCLRHVSSRRSN